MWCQKLHNRFCFLLNTSAKQCENLRTCKHDVCTCVKSAICILLLIPSSEKVITLLASQTLPENKYAFCVDMYLWTWKEEKKKSPGRQEAVWVCCKFIRPFYRQSDLTHVTTHRGTHAWTTTPTELCMCSTWLPQKKIFWCHTGFTKVLYWNYHLQEN